MMTRTSWMAWIAIALAFPSSFAQAGTAAISTAIVPTLTVGQAGSDSGGQNLLSRLRNGLRGEEAKPPVDPFTAAGRGVDNRPMPDVMAQAPLAPNPAMSPMPTAQQYPMPNPQGDPQGSSVRMATYPATPPLGGNPMAGPVPPGAAARYRADAALVSARKALAYGDTRRANEILNQARDPNVQYGLHDDSPDKVDASIRSYAELMKRRETAGGTEAYRRQYAQWLLEQSEWLYRWRELDEAERLASDADNLRLTYGPYEAKPGDLISRIKAARQQGPAGAGPLPSMVAQGPGSPGSAPANNFNAGTGNPAAKAQAQQLVQQARQALAQGQIEQAASLAQQAQQLQVPDSAFGPQEDRPQLVLWEVSKARMASGAIQGGGVVNTIYDASQPGAGVQHVQANGPAPPFEGPPRVPTPQTPPGTNSQGMALFTQGEQALQAGDSDRAKRLFEQAETFINELDPTTQQRLRGRLQYLNAGAGSSPLDAVSQQQALLRQQVSAKLATAQREARELQLVDPRKALQVLQDARKMVDESGLDPRVRDQLLLRINGDITAMEKYLVDNQQRLNLEDRNNSVRDEIERERRKKVEVGEEIAKLVDDFNKLMEQQRYAEAEVLAKRAAELAPDEAIVVQLKWQSRFVRRLAEQNEMRSASENGVIGALDSVTASAIPYDDRNSVEYPKGWADLTDIRRGSKRDRVRSEREIEIEQRLRTPVSLRFHDAPLSEVVDYLARLAEINVFLDPTGLAEEGVATDTPVTIDLRQDISLRSALNLVLAPLNLSYVIKDEVLKITSEQLRDGETYPFTYNVADLVIPIPNFTPNSDFGLNGAISKAYQQSGYFSGGFGGQSPLAVVASATGGSHNAQLDPTVLANLTGGGSMAGGPPAPMRSGPGGLGGGPQPDFDALIELITTTIAPTTWDEVGGPGSIAPFETNLSLVISQTQEVHDQIADLLEQLRRLQDLQVTIEVRFITLNDNFFERIGVDFDFDIDDDIDRPYQVFGRADYSGSTQYAPANALTVGAGAPPRDVQDRDHERSVTVGMSAPGMFSADLDIPVAQGSFPLATPQFGGYQPGAGAQVGFAILSDLEAFFFIEASQGDRRSNVLQAPKVTLFNGQQATVSDTSQSPFVISVIPVVGDFAAAQQPVIVVLNEGTFLTVQAVVSDDRRFVRLTVVPFFSTIGEVDTFTFTGSQSTTTNASSNGPDDATTARNSTRTASQQGTTVQLPTFSFVSVSTTVSVPDGGTVLLGGIKRLSEGRNEFGVPMLNKLPYINRLFKNVGIGRETQSLMMMVTPRIIIQEEEEALLGITPAP